MALLLTQLVGCAVDQKAPPTFSLPGSSAKAVSLDRHAHLIQAPFPGNSSTREQDLLGQLVNRLEEFCFLRDIPAHVWPVFGDCIGFPIDADTDTLRNAERDTTMFLPPGHDFYGGCSGMFVEDPHVNKSSPQAIFSGRFYHYQIAYFGISENFGLTCYNYGGWASGSCLILFAHDGRHLGRVVQIYGGPSDGFLPDLAHRLAQSDDPEIIPILFGRR